MIQNKNGAVPEVVIQNLAELSQLSPNGQNQELRVHCVQQMNDGQAIVLGEIVFRTFRGGFDCMQHLVKEGNKAAQGLLVQATSGLVLPIK